MDMILERTGVKQNEGMSVNNNQPPATIEEFSRRIIDLSGTLPKRLQQCADYIARNTDRIAVSTVAELAEKAGVQPSAVMRFCQIVGYSGYSEMQRLFRESYNQRWPDYDTRLRNLEADQGGSAAGLLAQFAEAGRGSLEELVRTVDPDALEAAVETLSRAPMIHIGGFRRAFPVASYLAYVFEKMGIPALLHAGVGEMPQRNTIRPADAILVISFEPYSRESVELVSYADTRGNPVVAITDSLASPILKSGGQTLVINEVDVGSFRSLSANMTLAVTLAVAVGGRRGSAK